MNEELDFTHCSNNTLGIFPITEKQFSQNGSNQYVICLMRTKFNF